MFRLLLKDVATKKNGSELPRVDKLLNERGGNG